MLGIFGIIGYIAYVFLKQSAATTAATTAANATAANNAQNLGYGWLGVAGLTALPNLISGFSKLFSGVTTPNTGTSIYGNASDPDGLDSLFDWADSSPTAQSTPLVSSNTPGSYINGLTGFSPTLTDPSTDDALPLGSPGSYGTGISADDGDD